MNVSMEQAFGVVEFLALIFVVVAGLMAVAVVILFIVDRTQTEDAIRRNYPVIGRFRHLFSELGEFFRQYFFAMDREELPFNRAQRDWVGRAGGTLGRHGAGVHQGGPWYPRAPRGTPRYFEVPWHHRPLREPAVLEMFVAAVIVRTCK